MHINLVIRFKLLCQHCTQVTSDINVDQFMHSVFRFVYFRVRATPTDCKIVRETKAMSNDFVWPLGSNNS